MPAWEKMGMRIGKAQDHVQQSRKRNHSKAKPQRHREPEAVMDEQDRSRLPGDCKPPKPYFCVKPKAASIGFYLRACHDVIPKRRRMATNYEGNHASASVASRNCLHHSLFALIGNFEK